MDCQQVLLLAWPMWPLGHGWSSWRDFRAAGLQSPHVSPFFLPQNSWDVYWNKIQRCWCIMITWPFPVGCLIHRNGMSVVVQYLWWVNWEECVLPCSADGEGVSVCFSDGCILQNGGQAIWEWDVSCFFWFFLMVLLSEVGDAGSVGRKNIQLTIVDSCLTLPRATEVPPVYALRDGSWWDFWVPWGHFFDKNQFMDVHGHGSRSVWLFPTPYDFRG